MKDSIFWDFMSGKCVMNIPKQFTEYADRSVKGITSFYLPTKEASKEPNDIRNPSKITGI